MHTRWQVFFYKYHVCKTSRGLQSPSMGNPQRMSRRRMKLGAEDSTRKQPSERRERVLAQHTRLNSESSCYPHRRGVDDCYRHSRDCREIVILHTSFSQACPCTPGGRFFFINITSARRVEGCKARVWVTPNE